jgi:uncharacterized protein (DUF58 family)
VNTSRLTLLLISLLVVVTLVARNPALYLLTALVLLMAGASAVWGRYCLAGVSYARQFGVQRLFCGETTDLWVEIVNAKPLPLAWLSADDDFPAEARVTSVELNRASDANRRTLSTVLTLRWYERVRRHYRLTFPRRGVYDFGPVVLSSGDLFGFRTRYLDLPQRQTVVVYPKVVPLEQLRLQAAHPLGDYSVARSLAADPLRLAGARDYRPGDSLRHVHWKATARRGALQTKTFDPSASHQLVVFLNAQTLEHAYEGVVPDYLETAIVVAASVAQAALDARYPVGLFTNGTARDARYRVRLPASRHMTQSQHILETLAHLTPFVFFSFEDLLRVEAPELPYGATLIAVSAVVSDSILSALLDVQARGHPTALIAVGPRPERSEAKSGSAALPIYSVTQNWPDLETLTLD